MKTVTLFNKSILQLLLLFTFSISFAQQYDYLKSVTSTGTGVTTDNSDVWTNLKSISIDVTNISKVFVAASINMRPDGVHSSGREANYRIYQGDFVDGVNSGVIKRQMIKNTETGVESWGIGTLVHIFDVSSLDEPISFTLEHSNKGQSSGGRNVYSSVRLTAIALTTTYGVHELSNDVKRLSTEVDITSGNFEPVPGLTTASINLPNIGDIYVVASINSRANGSDTVGEYKLEYSPDGGINWMDTGKEVKRTMVNNFDDGIISLVGLLQGKSAGANYQFRISHRRVSGVNKIYTNNVNLVAIALNHSGGSYFPSFYSEVGATGVDIIGESTVQATVSSKTFTTVPDIGVEEPDVFVSTQFLVSASNLNESTPQRMRAGNQLVLDNGTPISENEYYRYIPDNTNFGSGGTIGLAENLDANSLYTLSMKHNVVYVSNPDIPEDETLTTSEVILTGFQLFDKPTPTLGINEEIFGEKYKLYKSNSNIEFKSDKPVDATIRVYNYIGQLIETNSIISKREMTISNLNYEGIVFVSVEIAEGVYTKKMIF